MQYLYQWTIEFSRPSFWNKYHITAIKVKQIVSLNIRNTQIRISLNTQLMKRKDWSHSPSTLVSVLSVLLQMAKSWWKTTSTIQHFTFPTLQRIIISSPSLGSIYYLNSRRIIIYPCFSLSRNLLQYFLSLTYNSVF